MSESPPNPEESLSIVPFEDKGVRRVWDKDAEKWYFSVVDIIGVLSQSADPRNYWKVLKNRLKKEGSEVVTKCNRLKLKSSDGKRYLTDVADVETTLRLIQSVPSPKAEPIKQWLAKVGAERIEEFKDPEKAIHRAVATYSAKGHDDEWIGRRLRSIEVRNELTREWHKRGVENGLAFAMLTNKVYRGWSGMTSREYKDFKGLTDENLRDHMTTLELVLNMLAEASTAEIARTTDAQGVRQNGKAAEKGGAIAGETRERLEQTTEKSVISTSNHLPNSVERKQLP